MPKFCPFINSYCRPDCTFCRLINIPMVGSQTCLLAQKLGAAKPDDFKALGTFICQEIRKSRP